MKILAVFRDPDSARKALEHLAAADVEVYSGEPLELPQVRSRLAPAAILGGLAGAIGGAALAALTARTMGLYTGGMPLVAYAPVGIITFAGTAFGAIGATLGTLLWEAGLLNFRLELPKDARKEISAGAVAVVVETTESQRSSLERDLAHAGARIHATDEHG